METSFYIAALAELKHNCWNMKKERKFVQEGSL